LAWTDNKRTGDLPEHLASAGMALPPISDDAYNWRAQIIPK
jgi:hypothetical protein